MSPIYCVKFHCLILIVLQLGMGVCCMPSLKANVYRDLITTKEGRTQLAEYYQQLLKCNDKQAFTKTAFMCDAMCYYCYSHRWINIRNEMKEELENIILPVASSNVSMEDCRASCALVRELVEFSYNFSKNCYQCIENNSHC
ncbi:hypothetical protein EB796_006287 [Bugula neritina]|uniref:Uncharacterized protein n=1 Tax=Bugula neritina TaxID=10212 RepID=A0A7J7KB27_BUGNE|nr:hypothetical protein EB796_006287 [Bugula neritina]